MDSNHPNTPSAVATSDLRKGTQAARDKRVRVLKLDADIVENGIHTSTCPQCALNPTGKIYEARFVHVPIWIYLGLVFLPVLLFFYVFGRRIVRTQIHLCAPCKRSMMASSAARSSSFFLILCMPIIAALAGEGLAIDAGVLIMTSILAGSIGALLVHKATENNVCAVKTIKSTKVFGTTCYKKTLFLKTNRHFEQTLRKEAPHLFIGASNTN